MHFKLDDMADARTALFVIDIQDELARNPTTRIPHADRVVLAGERILLSARRAIANAHANSQNKNAKGPLTIVFVQHEETDGTLLRDSEAWGLVLPPQPSAADAEMLVAKTTRKLFFCTNHSVPLLASSPKKAKQAGDTFESNPGLAQRLRGEGVSNIVAFGIQSECCVLSTCQGALAAGFQVTLLRGAHSTYDGDGKSAAEIELDVETELQATGAQIRSWDDVIKSWE